MLGFRKPLCRKCQNSITFSYNTLINKSPHFGTSKYNFHKNNQYKNFQNKSKCIFYNQTGYKLYKCQTFIDCNHSQKSDFVNSKRLCKSCQGFNSFKNCYKYIKCNKLHHSLLHFEMQANTQNNYSNLNSNFSQNQMVKNTFTLKCF